MRQPRERRAPDRQVSSHADLVAVAILVLVFGIVFRGPSREMPRWITPALAYGGASAGEAGCDRLAEQFHREHARAAAKLEENLRKIEEGEARILRKMEVRYGAIDQVNLLQRAEAMPRAVLLKEVREECSLGQALRQRGPTALREQIARLAAKLADLTA
jgi:hypothetical protein